jgi:tetratricopeptide (TPR) repeat protein
MLEMPAVRRGLAPGLPFVVSAMLSLSTVGSHVYWQDSGFYLSAVHEMGVLYPHGFVLYQVLCKAWTSLLFFVDFALAVHLFSSFCTALAAGTIALAAREWLARSRPGSPTIDTAAAFTGCLAAAGYTFWFSGLYAKVYALFYLLLALLLHAVLRSAAAPTKKGMIRVALLAGLAWSVHPSVALGSLALAAYFLRAGKGLGWKPVALSLALGLVAALAPGLLLPLLSSRDVEVSMGHPSSASDVLQYLLGSKFTGIPGVFGPDGHRAAGFFGYFWEEYLGVGLLLLGLGLVRVVRSDRATLFAGLLWTLPYVLVTILFKIEGQSDHWYLAACLPLTLAVAEGFEAIAGAHPRGRVLQAAVASLGFVWAAVANYPDLQQKRYDLAEVFGKLYLERLEPQAILFAESDDVVATGWALQTVREVRRDVLLVNSSNLGAEGLWYDQCLKRHHPELRLPTGLPDVGPRSTLEPSVLVSAFLKANADGPRPLYVSMPLSADQLPPGYVLVPQGVVWKLAPAAEDRVDPRFWSFPLEPEEVPSKFRRSRGLHVTRVPQGFDVEYEPYERRLQRSLMKARTLLADWRYRHGDPAAALKLYESLLPLDPALRRNEAMLHQMSMGYLALGRWDQAEGALRATLEVSERPWIKALSWLGLGDIARGRGDLRRAKEFYREASLLKGLTPEQESAVRERLDRP